MLHGFVQQFVLGAGDDELKRRCLGWGLPRGFTGTEQERAEKRNQFAKKHRETLRRLGK